MAHFLAKNTDDEGVDMETIVKVEILEKEDPLSNAPKKLKKDHVNAAAPSEDSSPIIEKESKHASIKEEALDHFNSNEQANVKKL